MRSRSRRTFARRSLFACCALVASGVPIAACSSTVISGRSDAGPGPTGTGTITPAVPGEPPAPPPIPTDPPPGPGGPPRTYKVYVAGESIEARNQFFAAPFTSSGTRDDHGADANRADEFGWMVPFADRLKLRDPNISIEWVGTDTWVGVDDTDYRGTYPTSTAPKTSAQSGTSIPTWLSNVGNDDLQNKKHCYDVAFASRGGNDFSNTDDASFKSQLVDLIVLLSKGSSCRPKPLVYVTAHMPDDRQDSMSSAAFVAAQTQRYRTRIEDAVKEAKAANPDILVRFLDGYSGFRFNYPTKAVPSPAWFGSANFDFEAIHRDGKHPKRLASIYFGELVANGLDLFELRGLP
jgi:hypothetical protein